MLTRENIMTATWGKIDFTDIENLDSLTERIERNVGGVKGYSIRITEAAENCMLRHIQQYINACSFDDVYYDELDEIAANFSRFVLPAVSQFVGRDIQLIFSSANQHNKLFKKALENLPCFIQDDTEGF